MARRHAEQDLDESGAKRPRAGSAAEGEEASMSDAAGVPGTGGPDKENLLLVKLFQLAQPPAEKLTLASLPTYFEGEAEKLQRQQPDRWLEEFFLLLAKGWRRSEEGGVVPSTWAGIPPLHETILTSALTTLIGADTTQKVRAMTALFAHAIPGKLLNRLLEAAADDDDVPPQLLINLSKTIQGGTLNQPHSGQLGKLIRLLRSSKKYPQALVTSPCLEQIWRPAFEPQFFVRNKKREIVSKQRPGHALQSGSLLGWVLSPTCLDSALAPPSKAHMSEAGAQEWADLRRATRQRIDGLQRGTQMKLTGLQQLTAEFVDVMLRAGDGPRSAVLEWLGVLLGSAELRGKQGYIVPEGFNFWPHGGNHVIDVLNNDRNPPFLRSFKNMLLLQALHSRVQGFPTSGVALNACTLLLHLCKPIKPDQASAVSPYFSMREDIPDLLGNWSGETRFGEKEQIEGAKEVAQKDDKAFTVAPFDKSLFKTQLFWMTSKAVGVLLLPVAKEAFNTFQGIASVFYEKDPGMSDEAWREFLLAESALRENGFIEALGHFMDLSFRFLEFTAAGGQQALPPPEAGPAWHTLPTAMLENVLDICDLYRDRQRKGGGIPTGLFAHMDPSPVLTTLCIVMASDAHVRDPSLRGRAVKLLHRLCFAFPSWQEKLNQKPLLEHFVPCLVGVFVAVEKAILSYYDLAYRYKYELRVPVMDLFDLCLQHEEHRRVLKEFASGAGNDRFLKLLTQLINDTNSQTEEAIRTLKDYHEYQAKLADGTEAPPPPAPGAGGQHNEEVLGDDQTAEGEDVYRRSRMNYKEHAKKYFGLAQRTWKQLWLLCKHAAPTIVQGRNILEQLVHTSLDAQLHWLVGPEMKNIKGTAQEYEEVGFNPKEMVRQIAEIYLFLVEVDRAEVCRIVGKDERYYSNATFSKTVRFVRKYSLLDEPSIKKLDLFVKELAENVQQQRAAVDDADIPDQYLCELMADIMADPVQFPQSKKVVDRCNAERQIFGTDKDPYANTHVTKEMLVPLPDLKAEIHKFAKDKGIMLEGGNMYD
eukprot:TRINITY_DN28947_c0_g1_i1.p1 TRINITY_DN28947_c0_g1~~TRINITY_DN28947_c0_g1_i1.p1  ORF type:complete len:1038 (+),score=296.89 TRINITY_DN28947_c0_g1_i1:65-3178(+)